MATDNGPAGGDGGKKARPPAARKKSQKRQRQWQIKIPCLEKEFNDIAAAATAASLTKAAFGRVSMLGAAGARSPRRPSPDEKLLREVRGLQGKYGSNLNQIARSGNAGNPVDLPELRRALKQWDEIYNLLKKALGEYDGSGPSPVAPGPKQK